MKLLFSANRKSPFKELKHNFHPDIICSRWDIDIHIFRTHYAHSLSIDENPVRKRDIKKLFSMNRQHRRGVGSNMFHGEGIIIYEYFSRNFRGSLLITRE